ncbi:MAG: preprotein translocase subunit SecE [Eubacteriales bacterium]|nr:preprotein translocase subunit SecE [Eubacteriales bacterium]
MARKKTDNRGKKAKSEKPGFFKRVRNFFKGIWQELKRVSWTDAKTLRQNTATVLVIIFIAAASIWLFDMAIQGVLTASGFYTGHETRAIESPADAE